jgi:hypothetical protein
MRVFVFSKREKEEGMGLILMFLDINPLLALCCYLPLLHSKALWLFKNDKLEWYVAWLFFAEILRRRWYVLASANIKKWRIWLRCSSFTQNRHVIVRKWLEPKNHVV